MSELTSAKHNSTVILLYPQYLILSCYTRFMSAIIMYWNNKENNNLDGKLTCSNATNLWEAIAKWAKIISQSVLNAYFSHLGTIFYFNTIIILLWLWTWIHFLTQNAFGFEITFWNYSLTVMNMKYWSHLQCINIKYHVNLNYEQCRNLP